MSPSRCHLHPASLPSIAVMLTIIISSQCGFVSALSHPTQSAASGMMSGMRHAGRPIVGVPVHGRELRRGRQMHGIRSSTASDGSSGSSGGDASDSDSKKIVPLAKTPPMGWNGVNHFSCNVTEEIVKSTADKLISSGLAALGYTFVNLDDCWATKTRDAQGRLQADPASFPSGIKALADYVHSRGLKLGIYGNAGTMTCSGRSPGSLGFEDIDAATFAEWGIDYFKYDNCNSDGGKNPIERYTAMSNALKAVNRSIVYSICNWGEHFTPLWARNISQAWRTTPDIADTWNRMWFIVNRNNMVAKYGGPGHWNDADMLEVGNGGMSLAEYRVHFSLWALMKSPLLIGCDLRTVSSDILAILANEEVIAINQDALGVQGKRVFNRLTHQIFAGPLSNNRVVVALINTSPVPLNISVKWSQLGLPEWKGMKGRDLWKKQDLGRPYRGHFKRLVGNHDISLLVLSPTK